MKTENQYIIAYKGLHEGSHDFVFSIGKPFIEKHEFLEARNGSLTARVNMIKEATQLSFTVNISGFIEVPCDRCLDFFPLEIHFKGNLYAKFSGIAGDYDGEVVVLDPEEGEIDLSQYIFESIGLSIPYRKIHPPGGDNKPACNREMMTRIVEYSVSGEQKNNPMRDQLKDLK
ncbi:MAG: hypothetical protein A2Y71_05755 [Bacteroidetes bacterium RBG_13_42_15]|nr:MAG: hypothetical protein A2Y71_05755 [Bacteroidetes bacterium RBG_13_42_15]